MLPVEQARALGEEVISGVIESSFLNNGLEATTHRNEKYFSFLTSLSNQILSYGWVDDRHEGTKKPDAEASGEVVCTGSSSKLQELAEERLGRDVWLRALGK